MGDFNLKLEQYYKLKMKYETWYMDLIKRNEQREESVGTVVAIPKCINCKRDGGTIFNIKSKQDENNESITELTAICGVTVPCRLNINLQLSKCVIVSEMVSLVTNELDSLKDEMIVLKNRIMFGIESQASLKQKFTTLINEYNHMTTFMFDTLTLTQITPETLEKIRSDTLKQEENMNEYNNFIESQKWAEAVIVYQEKIIPLTKTLIDLKYITYAADVRTTKEYPIYTFRQIKHDPFKHENIVTENKVISWVVGIEAKEKDNKEKKKKDKDKTVI